MSACRSAGPPARSAPPVPAGLPRADLVRPGPWPCPAAGRDGSDLPPVWYTVSSLVNLFSFPKLWVGTGWTTEQLKATQAALAAYINKCRTYDGAACAVAMKDCMPGSYQVTTPTGDKGCLSCFGDIAAKGPRCKAGNTKGCKVDVTSTTGFYCDCDAIHEG